MTGAAASSWGEFPPLSNRYAVARLPMMSIAAVIFDVDGTLIDTNEAHVEAWERTFAAHQYHVTPEQIRKGIGMGGDQFIPSVLGKEVYERRGESLASDHSAAYSGIAESRRLAVYPGVAELLAELKRRQ